MRSPVDLRRSLEWAARAAALALLAWLLARTLLPVRDGVVGRAESASLGAALRRWSTTDTPARVHIQLDNGPGPVYRDWLAALSGAGARVTWQGTGLRALAATADPVADPAGGTRVLVAAPESTAILLADRFGALDSAPATPGGAAFLARSGPSEVLVQAGAVTARSFLADTLHLGRILVLGRVNWESKFVVAAMEERGWRVDARLLLSPKGNVLQGAGAFLDTARYAAAIVLDSAALRTAGPLGAFVRSGGGVILAGTAALGAGLPGLGAPGTGALVAAEEPFDTTAAEPRQSLGFRPIALTPADLPLDRRGAQAAVVARRVERGRVVWVSYEDTWRWRMAGRAGSADAYRDWWAGLVSGVAYTGRMAVPLSADHDEAPLASLTDRLGPPVAQAPEGAGSRHIPDAWLFGGLLALLLFEWASRRLRGAA